MDNAPSGHTPSQKPRFRFPRFSLRFFLIAVTIVCLFCVWLAYHVRRANDQKRAIEAWRRYAPIVFYDFQMNDGDLDLKGTSKWSPWLVDQLGRDFFHSVQILWVRGDGQQLSKAYDPALFQHLAGLTQLRDLQLKSGVVGDDELAIVGRLPRLQRFVAIGHRRVTDVGVADLARSRSLESIHLLHANISNESLRALGAMPRLTSLGLPHCDGVSDAGLKYLLGLRSLQGLCLCAASVNEGVQKKISNENRDGQSGGITDAGLRTLAGLKNLKRLEIQGGSITESGLREFQKRLPNCKVQLTEPTLIP
jgi:hypothetical protein